MSRGSQSGWAAGLAAHPLLHTVALQWLKSGNTSEMSGALSIMRELAIAEYFT